MISDIDPKTYAWLNSLKLGKRINTISQFQNGYYFGLIFDKLNLSKGKQFKNSHDMACIFQNYKNTKDLLNQNFKIEFPVNNIIYRTQQLLKTLRDACIKYEDQKKQATLKSVQDKILPQTMISQKQQNQFSLRQKQIKSMSKTYLNQTTKLPKKIQQIQKKLQKYRQQKTKHELFALQDRKKQIDEGRKVVQQHRNYQINKIRAKHQQIKQQQAKVYDVWLKTQQIKKMRVSKDEEFNNFMNQKKNKFYNSLREQQQKRFTDGISQFQLNCMRQGIQLEHDPTKQFKPKQDNFNSVVVMERIKDNIKDHQKQKKQRIKRQNKKRVDAQQAKEESEKLWKEITLLQNLESKMNNHNNYCQKVELKLLQQRAQIKTIQIKFKDKKHIPLKQIQPIQLQKRDEQMRKNKIIYLTKEVERLQKRYQKHKKLAVDALQAILMTTIVAEQKNAQSSGFSYSQWKQLQTFFVSYKKQNKKNKNLNISNQLSQDLSQYDQITLNYIHQNGQWQNNDLNQTEKHLIPQKQITDVVTSIIDNLYPTQTLSQKISLPLHMPLRIGISGGRLSGKSTQIQKLMTKYNLSLIDPRAIIKQAIQLAKPPVVQDSKKKKQAKKPQQQTPERIATKKFGQSILQKLTQQEVLNQQKISIQHLISAIKFKIQLLFKSKTNSQLIQTFNQQRQKQQERLKQQLKDLQQGNKKKKDSKKGGETVVQVQPKFNPYFFTSGFIFDNIQLNAVNLKLIQKELNGYVSQQEKINPLGQQIKRELSQILPIPQRQRDLTLKKGFFNILIDLKNVNKESAQQRNNGRKIDPQTQIIYHPKFNPVPNDIKGLAQRLIQIPIVNLQSDQNKINSVSQQVKDFYSLFGSERTSLKSYCQFDSNESIQEIFGKLTPVIQKTLDVQYQEIQLLKTKLNKSEEKVNQNKALDLQQKPIQNVETQKQQSQKNQQISEQNIIQKGQTNEQIKQERKNQSLGDVISKIQVEKLAQIMDKFQKLNNSYKQKVKINLYQFEVARKTFETDLIDEQRQFTSIINRPDDKAGKILNFQDNYNKLLQQKQSIIKDKQATKHLIQKLDDLYDSLWVSIQGKKNQAVNFRQNFLYSNWMNKQSQKLAQILKQIIQNQLNYILQTLFFVLSINLAYCKDGHQPVIDYLCLGVPEEAQPISTIDLPEVSNSKRINYYINQTQKCLEEIPLWFKSKYFSIKEKQIRSKTQMNESLEQLAQIFIKNQTINLKKIMVNLKDRIMERIRQQICYYKCLVNKMDDWIILGIKAENDFVYEIYKTIKQSILQIKKSNIRDLFPNEITLVLKPIQKLTQEYIPIPSQQFSLQIFSYKIFLQEIKCLTYYKNQNLKINFNRFKEYFQKRKRSKLLHQQFLKLDYDTTQQYLVSDGECNFKEIAIAALFWNQIIFDLESIKKYQKQLKKDSSNNSLQNSQINHQGDLSKIKQTERENQQSQFLKNQSEIIENSIISTKNNLLEFISYEEFFLPENLNLNEKEIRIVKKIVFDILKQEFSHKVYVDQWIDILKMFNLLQIYKFGDAIMMLNQQKN